MERCAPWRNVAPSRTTATWIRRGVRIVSLASVTALTLSGCDAVSDPQDSVVWSKLQHTVTVAVGQRHQIGVAALGSAPTWVSDNPQVASVSSTGLTSALAPGRANVILHLHGHVDTTLVIVHAAVRAIHMVASFTPLALGGAMGLAYHVIDPAGDEITDLRETPIQWVSRDSTVASVDPSGLIRAKALGQVAIVLIIDGQSDSTLVRVTPEAPPGSPIEPIPPSQQPPKTPTPANPPPAAPATASVVITLDSTGIAPGHSSAAHAVAKDAKGNALAGKTAAWTSLNTAVATVSSEGIVTARSGGSAAIQGVIDGVSGTASFTVTAPPVATPPVTPPPTSSPQLVAEPVFDATQQTMLFDENFDSYTNAMLHPACGSKEVPHRVIDHSWYYCTTFSTNGGPGVDNGVQIVPGRSGNGVSFHYDGISQESHGVVTTNGSVPVVGQKTVFVQYWAKWTPDAGYSLTTKDAGGNWSAIVQIKNIMLWHGNNRLQFNTHSHSGTCPIYGPSYTMIAANDVQQIGCESDSPAGPYFGQYADGQWHRWTIQFKPNSAPGARDGIARLWIDGQLTNNLERSACGVKPTGGWKPWCDVTELDGLNSTSTGVGVVEWGGPRTDASGITFSIAIDDFKWWTTK